jgi:hypothetical protein
LVQKGIVLAYELRRCCKDFGKGTFDVTSLGWVGATSSSLLVSGEYFGITVDTTCSDALSRIVILAVCLELRRVKEDIALTVGVSNGHTSLLAKYFNQNDESPMHQPVHLPLNIAGNESSIGIVSVVPSGRLKRSSISLIEGILTNPKSFFFLPLRIVRQVYICRITLRIYLSCLEEVSDIDCASSKMVGRYLKATKEGWREWRRQFIVID